MARRRERSTELRTTILATLLLVVVAVLGHGRSETVRVVAASDLQFALSDVAERFEALHPDVEVDLSFGSSGVFYTLLVQGRPADLYFSADARYPELLGESGLLEPGTRRPYAVGRLALWVSRARIDAGLDPEEGLALLRDPQVTRVAIANPAHAPYGRAALSLLERAGLATRLREVPWEALTDGVGAAYDLTPLEEGKRDFQLVYGENVSQAAQIAISSTGVGIVALSLALGDEMTRRGEHWLAPIDAHDLLQQDYAMLRGMDRPAVRDFHAFVGSDEAREVFERYGFMLPGAPLD